MSTDATVAADPLLRPVWRRARFWVALAVVAVLAAVVVGSLFDSPGRRLDPASADKDGSEALARITARYGIPVATTDSLATARAALGAGTSVVVAEPEAYSSAQLRTLVGTGRLVLLRPNSSAARAVVGGTAVDGPDTVEEDPGCSVPAATAAGTVAWPDDTVAYTTSSGTSCYGGAVVLGGRVALVGSADVVTNERLADAGTAALAVNVISADRSARRVVWLLPGTDAGGDGPASVWDLFPDGAYRVFWWVVGVALLLVLWRARRLGAVVSEPLPVVVRAAELVEGHGRLYERAGARERAATVLRDAARRRLADRLGMSATATTQQLASAATVITGRPATEIVRLLDGPAPTDDEALVDLADALDALTRDGQ